MRDYDAILADATDRSPFSNGTSGELWMGKWCYRCKRDAAFLAGDSDQGCPLLLVALMQKTPKEWTETGLQNYHCSEFKPLDGGGGEPEPEPIPVCDGQVDMFGVFAEQIADQPQRELVTR
jgi:hypothetical protein